MVTITDLLSTADKADLNEDDDLDVTESLYPSSPELLEATEVVSRLLHDANLDDEEVVESSSEMGGDVASPGMDMFDAGVVGSQDLLLPDTDSVVFGLDQLQRTPGTAVGSGSDLAFGDANDTTPGFGGPGLFDSPGLDEDKLNEDFFDPSPLTPTNVTDFLKMSMNSLLGMKGDKSIRRRPTSLLNSRRTSMPLPLKKRNSFDQYNLASDPESWTALPLLDSKEVDPDPEDMGLGRDKVLSPSHDLHYVNCNGFAPNRQIFEDQVPRPRSRSPEDQPYFEAVNGRFFETSKDLLGAYEQEMDGMPAHIFVNGGHIGEADRVMNEVGPPPTGQVGRRPPTWEERRGQVQDYSNDVLHLDMEMNPPRDRFNLIYLTFILHGVGTLMPWNMFITAKQSMRRDWFNMLTEYFVDYKLSTDYAHGDTAVPYATYFLQYIGFAAQVPNVIFNWINIFLNVSGSLTSRIVWTLLIEVIIFVVTIVLAMIDSRTWPGIFFYLTIFSVIILNMVNGIYQNTVYGLAAKLPFKYTGAVVLGSNLSGTIVAIINLISIYAAPNPRTAAIYYFITALFILLASFDTYFALPLNRFFRHYDHKYNHALQEKRMRNIVIPYFTVFRQSFAQCFNVFFTFFVTLTIFPAVHADIQATDKNFFISPKYFTAWTCFLTFNLFAVLGNLLPSLFKWPSPRWLFIPILLRFFFVPFFLLSNYRPANVERILPVLFHSDGLYWAAGALLGLTGGYFSSMAMLFCPRSVQPEYASVAAMFGAASIVTGIFAGIGFSYLMPTIVSLPELNFEVPSWWPKYNG